MKQFILCFMVISISHHLHSNENLLNMFYDAFSNVDVETIERILIKYPVDENLDFYRKNDLISHALKTQSADIVILMANHNVPLYITGMFSYISIIFSLSNQIPQDFLIRLINMGYPINVYDYIMIPKTNQYFPIIKAIYEKIGRTKFESFLDEYFYWKANGEGSSGLDSVFSNLYITYKNDEYYNFYNFLVSENLLKNYVTYTRFNDSLNYTYRQFEHLNKKKNIYFYISAMVGMINDDSVRIRNEPGLNSKILGLYNRGEVLKIIGIKGELYQYGSMTHPWVQIVDRSGLSGWVYGEYIDSTVLKQSWLGHWKANIKYSIYEIAP